MTPEVRQFQIGTEIIGYVLKRTGRKTLGISVLSDGSVQVAAPRDVAEEEIEGRLRKKAAWILAKIEESVLRVPQLPERKYVPGETHLYLGRQYRLRVEPETYGTRREESRIIVGGVSSGEPRRIRNRLFRWYESEGNRIFAERLTECLRRFGATITRPKLRVSAMEKRWGSYVASSHSLLLNHALVQVPVPLIDYVITHELCHVQHPHHGRDFELLLGRMMPDHIQRKRDLERAIT